jgi:hypothetical protein
MTSSPANTRHHPRRSLVTVIRLTHPLSRSQTPATRYIARKRFHNLSQSVSTIQSTFRYIAALTRVREMVVADKIRQEALKAGMDQAAAEKAAQEKLAAMSADKKDAAERKANDLKDAEARMEANEDVDDAAMVDDMFGFADDDGALSCAVLRCVPHARMLTCLLACLLACLLVVVSRV